MAAESKTNKPTPKSAPKPAAKADSKAAAKVALKPAAPKAAVPKPAAPAAPEPVRQKLFLEPHQIILRPLVTEKGMHRSTRHNAYAFEITRAASKDDVRRAVEELFHVKVLKVNTQNRKGKPRRTRSRGGQTKDWKKAVVTLDSEHRIDFF